MPNQRTLARAVSCRGVGLHTGHSTTMTFRPAPPHTGLVFCRVDLPQRPQVPADIAHVQSTDRGTTIGIGSVQVHTVEHVLAALYALEIDNCVIELDAPEPPVLDGSALAFANAIHQAGAEEQDAERAEVAIVRPLAVSYNDISVMVMPADELRVSYTIAYGHPALGSQFTSIVITPESFLHDVAGARTFCFLADVEALKATGLIRGGSLDNAVVIGEETVLNEHLRFPDEFVRHKVLDLLGDLALFGRRLRGHVTAVKAGHGAHIAFIRELRAHANGSGGGNGHPRTSAHPDLEALGPAVGVAVAQRYLPMGREAIKRILPHREPFLFVDTITELREDFVAGRVRFTEDHWFFRGHFPNMPVTPGVIMLEALAQVGGVLTRLLLPDPGSIPVLLTLEEAKFRHAVRPGDEVRIEVEPLRMKRRLGKLRGRAYLGDTLACEGKVVFTMLPAAAVRTHVGPGV